MGRPVPVQFCDSMKIFLVRIISGMTATDLEAHNGLGNEREGATMGLEVYQDVKTIHGLFRQA